MPVRLGIKGCLFSYVFQRGLPSLGAHGFRWARFGDVYGSKKQSRRCSTKYPSRWARFGDVYGPSAPWASPRTWERVHIPESRPCGCRVPFVSGANRARLCTHPRIVPITRPEQRRRQPAARKDMGRTWRPRCPATHGGQFMANRRGPLMRSWPMTSADGFPPTIRPRGIALDRPQQPAPARQFDPVRSRPTAAARPQRPAPVAQPGSSTLSAAARPCPRLIETDRRSRPTASALS